MAITKTLGTAIITPAGAVAAKKGMLDAIVVIVNALVVEHYTDGVASIPKSRLVSEVNDATQITAQQMQDKDIAAALKLWRDAGWKIDQDAGNFIFSR